MLHPGELLRTATIDDRDQLLSLWDLLFEDAGPAAHQPWRSYAQAWFESQVDGRSAHVAVVETDGAVVATATGTLELGVPNPFCPQGRTVRLVNVVTLPRYRSRGYASTLAHEMVGWARQIDADRVDLTATPEAQTVYERLGFVRTSAPRMKLVLAPP